jgi:hypothetical protein
VLLIAGVGSTNGLLRPFHASLKRSPNRQLCGSYAAKLHALLCKSASKLDPWRIHYNALQLNAFRQKTWGPGWTPIEHPRNKKFHFWFNDLVLKRGGVQVGRRFTKVLGLAIPEAIRRRADEVIE